MTIHVRFDTTDPDRLILDSNLSDQGGIEAVPGSRYKGKGTNKWRIPRTYTGLLALVNTFPNGHITFDDDVKTWYVQEHISIDSFYNLIHDGLDDETRAAIQANMPDGFIAKNDQIDGAVFLGSVKGGGVFDEAGKGKSATVAMALMLYKAYPSIIVCPKSLIYNWRRELDRFNIKSAVLIGTAAQRRKTLASFDPEDTPVMITTYEMVKAHGRIAGYGNIALKRCKACGGKAEVDEKKCEAHVRELNLIDWKTVIVDEGHRINDPHSAQTRAVWALSEKAENRWELTATPVEDNPVNFWSFLRFISPAEWSGSSKFRDRFCHQRLNYWGGTEVVGLLPETVDEFKRVTGWRWIRRFHDGLPEVTTETRTCTLSAKELKAYKQMDAQLMAELPDGEVLSAENNMVAWGRLNLFCNGTVNVDPQTEKVFLSEPSSKLDLLEDTLLDYTAEPVIVWFNSVDMLEMFKARLESRTAKTKAKPINFSCVYGNMGPEAVDKSVADFQEGNTDLIMLTTSKGSEGITLTRARVAMRPQRAPSSIKATQVDGRNKRIGSEIHMEKGILDINLIAENTIEEEYDEKQEAKQERIEETLAR